MRGITTIWAFAGEQGALRENQEDFYGEVDGRFFCLADGLGGQPYGETAAKLAVDICLRTFRLMEYRSFYRWRAYLVKQAIKKANLGIYKMVQKKPEFSGMATTLVDLFLSSKQWTIGNVGDSRVYILSGGNFRQITVDHEDKEGRLTKVAGMAKKIVADSFEGQIYSGDLFLLCSDGLTDRLTNEEIGEVLKISGETQEDLEKVAQKLLSLANKKGPGENTTVCLVRALKGTSLPEYLARRSRPRMVMGKRLKIFPKKNVNSANLDAIFGSGH